MPLPVTPCSSIGAKPSAARMPRRGLLFRFGVGRLRHGAIAGQAPRTAQPARCCSERAAARQPELRIRRILVARRGRQHDQARRANVRRPGRPAPCAVSRPPRHGCRATARRGAALPAGRWTSPAVRGARQPPQRVEQFAVQRARDQAFEDRTVQAHPAPAVRPRRPRPPARADRTRPGPGGRRRRARRRRGRGSRTAAAAAPAGRPGGRGGGIGHPESLVRTPGVPAPTCRPDLRRIGPSARKSMVGKEFRLIHNSCG